MKRRVAAGAILAGLALLLPACGPLSPSDIQREALEEAEQAWRRQGFTSYEFRVQRICFCIPTGALIVRVQEGRPVSVTNAETGEIVNPDPFVPVTVEGLFAVVEDAIDRDARRLDVDYDDAFGYPRTIDIDFRTEVADDEIFYQASDLRQLR
jgi:hypothetical protein